MEYSLKESYNFEDLKIIMKTLRSKNGCPWDREQTHKSIRNNFIEEVYEAAEAIDENNPELLKEELGDVLLQIVFHAQIGEEEGEFDIDGICDGICKKLINRHPHIFSDVSVDNSRQVLSNWENIKIDEKGYKNTKEYIESTAKSLPALMRAEKIQKRLIKRKVINQKESKIIIQELSENIEKLKDTGLNIDNIGKILYDAAALAAVCNIDPEQALYNFNNEIIKILLNN